MFCLTAYINKLRKKKIQLRANLYGSCKSNPQPPVEFDHPVDCAHLGEKKKKKKGKSQAKMAYKDTL